MFGVEILAKRVKTNKAFNDFQLKLIEKNKKLNLEKYLDPSFDQIQAEEVVMGLKWNLPVSAYAFRRDDGEFFSASQMGEIRMTMQQGLDISRLVKRNRDGSYKDSYEMALERMNMVSERLMRRIT